MLGVPRLRRRPARPGPHRPGGRHGRRAPPACSATGSPSTRSARRCRRRRSASTLNLYPVTPARRPARRPRRRPPHRRAAEPLVPRPDAARRATPTTCAPTWRRSPTSRSGPRRRPRGHRRARSTSSASTTTRGTSCAPAPFPGAGDGGVQRPAPAARPRMGWERRPRRARRGAGPGHRDYTDLPLYVTENGSACDDAAADGRQSWTTRVGSPTCRAHLDACRRAVEAGVPLAGYFAWSLLDNFEWADGYANRFGLVHVDYATQRADGEGERPLVRRVRAGCTRRHTDAMTRAPSGGPTLEQVAALAGVGRGTASRVINGSVTRLRAEPAGGPRRGRRSSATCPTPRRGRS